MDWNISPYIWDFSLFLNFLVIHYVVTVSQ